MMLPQYSAVASNPEIAAKEALVSTYQQQGLVAEAYAALSELVRLRPPRPEDLTSLGIAAQGMDRLAEAIQWYRQALQLSPNYAIAHSNLANCLKLADQPREAEFHYRQALTIDPMFADAHSNFGNLLKESGRVAEAIASYQHALAVKPTHANAWSNLGGCFKDSVRIDEAIAAYRRALVIQPNFPIAMANLVHCLTTVCDWPARDALLGPLMDMLRQQIARGDYGHVVQPHHALVYPLPAADQVFIARAFATGIERAAQRLFRANPTALSNTPHARWQPGERVRVGYMSSDFGNHPLSQLMQRCFGMHDRTRFEVFGYAVSANDGTPARRLIEDGFEHFFDVHQYSIIQLTNFIRSHQLHVLVDLNGYTRGARAEVLALRPAPVQAHYMGFAGTLAAPFIDYLITDEVASPPQHFDHYAEKLALMPNSYFVNDHMQTYPPDFHPAELATRASLGLPQDKFIFACFNQLLKIDPSIFAVWARLLKRVPDSVLWLLRFPPTGEPILRRIAEQQYGIDPSRMIFTAVSVNKEIYMRFIHLADLVLDTPQYNGHTSGCDVLWAGVPIVTLTRQHMASRVCASLLRALGCPELVCSDESAYEALAGSLATPFGRPTLMALRAKVRNNRFTTPLFNTRQWVREVEVVYRAMAERHASGLAPDHLFFRAQHSEARAS